MSCSAGPKSYSTHVWGEGRKRCVKCNKLNGLEATPKERFFEFTQQLPTGCILWTSSTRPNGYGVYTLPPHHSLSAHRCAWFFEYGEIPPRNMDLDHLCRIKLCVNVKHLRLVTHLVNIRAKPSVGVCRMGHKLEGKNAMLFSEGKRRCRACYTHWLGHMRIRRIV